jgi:biopolymer transport protein ExbD
MAGVQPAAQGKGGGAKTALGLRKRKRVGIGIDMTPMVDVAFLLLIFFMVTTVFRRPLAMEVNMPEPGAKVEVKESNVMTLYVGEDGSMLYDIGRQGLNPVTWDELGEVLVLEADYNPDLIVLAKVDRKARYEYMVDLLDTFDDAQMERFSVIPMTEEDKAIMEGM